MALLSEQAIPQAFFCGIYVLPPARAEGAVAAYLALSGAVLSLGATLTPAAIATTEALESA